MVRFFRPLPSFLLPFCVVFGLSGVGASAQPELVIQKEGTKVYHRPGCEAVRDGKGVLALTRGQAEARGLKPHAACDPAASRNTGAPAPSDDPPTFVYVDESRSKYYHLEKCSKLQKGAKRVALEAAGKTLWPCPRCRPPIRKRSAAPAIPRQAGA